MVKVDSEQQQKKVQESLYEMFDKQKITLSHI